MNLYVANCTHQMQTVNYRLVEGKGKAFNTQNIEVGQQIRIAGDLNTPQIDSVVEQLTMYGLHSLADLHGAGTKRYVPLLFSIDKPIPAKLMHELIDHNRGLLREFGTKLRREAAIATSHGMRAYSPNAAETLSMSVEEEKSGTMDHGGDKPLAEGFRIDREFGMS